MKFAVETTMDPRLLDLSATDLHTVLTQPTLFDLREEAQRPLFVSVLLHGNEITGWDAIRSFLAKTIQTQQKVSLVLLVGNVRAAKHGLRSVNGQPDFNRIWEGGQTLEHHWADEVIEYVQATNPWFALDIHNNTAPNPHHSVITDTDSVTLSAARNFSPIAIYARQPQGVLSRRCAQLCPSITIEVGLTTDHRSSERTLNYIRTLHENGLEAINTQDLEIFENTVRVVLEYADRPGIEHVPTFMPLLHEYNFKTIPTGTRIAEVTSPSGRLIAVDEDMNDVTEQYLQYNGNSVSIKNDVVMSMYTEDPLIVKQDCVCYFLEPIDRGWDQRLSS